MASVKCFEDLEVWQASRKLSRDIYGATHQADFKRDFGLRDQIRRAAVSVMSNIAEGFERESDRDFHRFLSIAKASAGEVRSQLYLAEDVRYIDAEHAQRLRADCVSISRRLSALMKHLKA